MALGKFRPALPGLRAGHQNAADYCHLHRQVAATRPLTAEPYVIVGAAALSAPFVILVDITMGAILATAAGKPLQGAVILTVVAVVIAPLCRYLWLSTDRIEADDMAQLRLAARGWPMVLIKPLLRNSLLRQAPRLPVAAGASEFAYGTIIALPIILQDHALGVATALVFIGGVVASIASLIISVLMSRPLELTRTPGPAP